jgi:hypothetical protein
MERKLTAILCTDVHGYSRLTGEDEEATHRTLTSYRKLIDSLIEQYHGRFINSARDSVLPSSPASSMPSNAQSKSRPRSSQKTPTSRPTAGWSFASVSTWAT